MKELNGHHCYNTMGPVCSGLETNISSCLSVLPTNISQSFLLVHCKKDVRTTSLPKSTEVVTHNGSDNASFRTREITLLLLGIIFLTIAVVVLAIAIFICFNMRRKELER